MTHVEARRVPDIARGEGQAFGTWIASDVPLPLSAAPAAASQFTVRIRVGVPNRRLPGDVAFGLLGGPDQLAGEVSPYSGTVWLRRRPTGSELCWGGVLGLALPHLVHARGTHVLHASSVSVGGVAIAFLGPPRAGKSSVAAALVHRGWHLVSDDALPVAETEGRMFGQPAFPAIRLFTATATWFAQGDHSRMRPIHPRSQKWWVALDQAEQWHGGSRVPLRCLCLLDRTGPPSARLRGTAATMAVLSASYRSPVDQMERMAVAFEAAHRLAATVPVIRLALPRDLPPPASLGDLVMERMTSAGVI